MSKKIISLFLSLILVLGSTVAFAADFDLKNKETGTVTPLDDVLLNDDLFLEVAFDKENYTVEFGGKLYNLAEVQAKFDADPTLTMEEAVADLIPVGEEEEEDLKVIEISAINKTEVTVTLANVPSVLPEGSAFSVEDSNGNVYAVTSIALIDGNEYKLTLGTAVSGKGTLTVKYGTSEAELDFDYTVEGITLSMEFSDEDATLVADGADNTIVTIKVLQDGELNVDFDGTVKFMSLKGATFAKETVAFDKGVARVQLTSMSSAVDIMDTIIATIADADDIEAVGKSVQMQILYSPIKPGDDDEVAKKVFITYAESDRASDIFVRFNDDIDFDALYAEHFGLTPGANGKLFVQSPITTNQAIADIISVDARTVKLVFVEDSSYTTSGWLTDNSVVRVGITNAGQPNSVLLDGFVNFNLVDPKAPEALAVNAPDYKTIETRFTEPIRETPVETVGNWVLNGTQLKAMDIENDDATTTPLVGRKYKGTHTIYDANESVDNRSYATLNLSVKGQEKLKPVGEVNILQAYNIEDYAGKTDLTGDNTATTQEFRFVTPARPGAPKAKVELESPEQYRVTFDQPLRTTLDEDNFEVSYQIGVRANGTPIFIGDTDAGTLVADAIAAGTMPGGFGNPTTVNASIPNANQVVVTPVAGTDNTEYLLEFAQDWTVTYDTEVTAVNYYTPGRNHIAVTVVGEPAGGIAVESRAGIVMPGTYTEAKKMARDYKGPLIDEAYQNQNPITDAWLQEFTVRMNEPVQMNTKLNAGANDTNLITPSQTQAYGDDVPTPTFQFISEDESITIDGELDGPITIDDYEFVIVPRGTATLTPGIWTISIKSISDDVGNTADTVEYTLEVEGTTDPEGDARIIWADAHDNVQFASSPDVMYDVVHIQYGTEMSLDALQSNIYTINGKILPVSTMVTSVESEYTVGGTTLEGTLVTLTLPKEFLGDIGENPVNIGTIPPTAADYDLDISRPANTPHMLNVSKQLTDTNGNKITGDTEVQLPYNLSAIDHSGLVSVTGVNVNKGTQLVAGSASTPGTAQVIDTVVKAATGTGNIKVTVGSQTPVSVAVATGDDADVVAGKIAAAVATEATAEGFTVSAKTGGIVRLTANVNAADVTVNVTIVDTDSTGATVATASTTSTNGKAPTPATKQKDVLTVTVPSPPAEAGTLKVTVTIDDTDYVQDITIVDGDTANAIAGKIQSAFTIAGWTLTQNGANVEFEANVAAADVTFTVSAVNQ